MSFGEIFHDALHPPPAIDTVDLEKSVAPIPIFKIEHEQRVVRGVVTEPCSENFCVADTQGDIMSEPRLRR